MPRATLPTVPAGSLSSSAQPSLTSADGELVLRPWEVGDAAALYAAFQNPEIRRWHARDMSSLEEGREWIAAANQGWHGPSLSVVRVSMCHAHRSRHPRHGQRGAPAGGSA